MTLKELEPQLLSLTPPEKAQAIQILAQSLANTWQGIIGDKLRL
jgi:predicted enzyme involved in methoxymalonyl-ACP biosynthesis